MAWGLEIHHVDVQCSGDSTLIIAREVAPLAGPVARVRSALIDGGRVGQGGHLHAYIVGQLGANPLNVMIATHYDKDHLPGLTHLLLRSVTYNNVRIYDQGWPSGGQPDILRRYLRAINGMNDNGPVVALAGALARTRITSAVQADGMAPNLIGPIGALGPPALPALPAVVNAGPNWLLTAAAPAEILWDGVPGGIPAGAPTITCIAANRFVRGPAPAGGIVGPIAGGGADDRNEKSLVFEVRFNNFRYYVGGDIETAQENSIQVTLNPADDGAGRVPAMKASHHGANTATSRAFVDRLRPTAAFISCGRANQYFHPAQETINVLDGFAANPGGIMPAPPHLPVPPNVPPFRPVEYYLTGYQVVGPPPLTYGGDTSTTAGDPTVAPAVRGDIRLTVNLAQSNRNALGRRYLGVQIAAQAAAGAAGMPGALAAGPAAVAATAAAEAALSFGVARAAGAVIASAGLAAALVLATRNAATAAVVAGNAPGVMATAVTAAAMAAGVAAGPAAGAGAAAGACRGFGTQAAVQNAVTAALTQAGLAAAAALGAAAGAALLAAVPPGGLFSVTLHEMNFVANPQTFTHS